MISTFYAAAPFTSQHLQTVPPSHISPNHTISPADETPTEFDALLAELESALDALLTILGPLFGLTREQVQIIEADIDALIKDLESTEHGEIDIDSGLEIIVQDLIKILHDFGVQLPQKLDVETTSE